MRSLLVPLLLLLHLSACTPNGPLVRQSQRRAGSPWTRLSTGIGVRQLDELGGGDDATSLFLDFEEGHAIGPLRLEGGFHNGIARRSVRTTDGRESLETQFAELSVGLRADADGLTLPLVPYVGAGGSVVYARSEYLDANAVRDDDDVTFGIYAKAGLAFRLDLGATVGFEVRRLWADDYELGPLLVDADATQFALVFGTGL